MAGMAKCRDCGREIEWRKVKGRNVPFDPDTEQEHWLSCPDPDAEHRRVRAGKVPGVYPMSISRINDYRLCPQLYFRRQVLRQPEPELAEATIGKAFHEYVAARLHGAQPPPPPSPVLSHVHEWQAMTAAFDAQIWDTDPEKLFGIEDKITYEWQDEAMTVAFEGVLDLVTVDGSEAMITDFKTGWGIPSPQEMFTNLQAQAYALMLWRNHPSLKRIRFQQVQFRFRGRTVAAIHPTEKRDYYVPYDLEVFEEALKAETGRILRDRDFEPNPACNICPIAAHEQPGLALWKPLQIEVATGFVEIPPLRPPQNQQEAIRLALIAHVARRVEEAAKRAVRGWCETEGPIWVSPGEALGHWETESQAVIDVPAALQVLADGGHDLNRFAHLSLSELKPLLKPDNPRYEPLLAALVESKTNTKFGFRKHVTQEKKAAIENGTVGTAQSGRPQLVVLEGGPELK